MNSLQLHKRADKSGEETDGPWPLEVVDVGITPNYELPRVASFSEAYVGREGGLGWLELTGGAVAAQDWESYHGKAEHWQGLHAESIVLHTRLGEIVYDVTEQPGLILDPNEGSGYRVERRYLAELATAPRQLLPSHFKPKREVAAADFVFNIALGRFVYYGTLPSANDAWIVVLLTTTGVEADGTLRDYDTLSALLAAANTEADFTNYVRKSITSVTVTVDDTNNWTDTDVADQTWASAGNGTNNTLSDLLFNYDPDTTGGDDTTIIPLSLHDFSVVTDGSDLTAQIATAGTARAAAA